LCGWQDDVVGIAHRFESRQNTNLFSFAGVSAAKEKAVDFAVFAPRAKPRERDKRAVRYRKGNVIELVDTSTKRKEKK
jgi:hypothetical protein